MYGKTPIAWLQLRYQRAQTLAAGLGISFITILLFMQIGFRTAFLDTITRLPLVLQSDLIMMNASAVTVLRPPTFSQVRLYQALSVEGVASVSPMYMGSGTLRDPAGGEKFLRKLHVYAFPLSHPALPVDPDALERLKRRRAFLLDAGSRKNYLPTIALIREQGQVFSELRSGSGQTRISLEGLFLLGANANNDAHMLTSDSSFMEVFRRERGSINLGLIRLKPGADLDQVRDRLRAAIPGDVAILTNRELLQAERHYFEFNIPTGLIFRFGLVGVIVVGIVILYQILFQMVTKYLRDYATLKAIGFSHGTLRWIVLKSAFILALLGFVPGFVGSIYVYRILQQATSLVFNLTATNVALVFSMVCFICLLSATLAIRKLRDADPADLFG